MVDKEKGIKDIADYYGLQNQLLKLTEECGEVIQAAIKFHHSDCLGIVEEANLIEEIADVELMVSQIKYLAGIENEVNVMFMKKIQRQVERMKDGN